MKLRSKFLTFSDHCRNSVSFCWKKSIDVIYKIKPIMAQQKLIVILIMIYFHPGVKWGDTLVSYVTSHFHFRRESLWHNGSGIALQTKFIWPSHLNDLSLKSEVKYICSAKSTQISLLGSYSSHPLIKSTNSHNSRISL